MSRRIYVASSWRNEQQPEVVKRLRAEGHQVYDFRDPPPGTGGQSWRSSEPDFDRWTPAQYRDALEHPIAIATLGGHLAALRWADTILFVAPAGRSAAIELGFGIGAGVATAVLLAPGEPELMFGLANKLCLDLDEVVTWLRSLQQHWYVDHSDNASEGGCVVQADSAEEAIRKACEEGGAKPGSPYWAGGEDAYWNRAKPITAEEAAKMPER